MQNMWISVALIVAVIIVGIIAGKRLSTPGPQRRAVYFAFGTLAVLALWFFIFVAFFPAEWIVPFFTVACIIIPICVYMMVLRSGGKERAKAPSKRSFEIPKKDITVESAKAASTVSSGTASASSATTPSKAATPAPSASQQTAPASSTPTSAAKTDTSSASATKAKAPATAAVATAPAKPAASEAPKATAKPSVEASKTSAKEAPKPKQPTAKAEAPSTQKSTTESAPVAAPASTKPVEPAKSTEPQKAKPTKPTKQAAKPASHEAASKPFANKEHVTEIAIEEATEKTPEPPVKATPATTSPSEDQLREAAEIEILVDRAAEEEAAKIEELVRPFASQATPTMNAEKERELNVGAPVGSSKEKTPTNKEVTPAKASSAPAATPTPAPTPESTPKPAAKPAPKPAKIRCEESQRDALAAHEELRTHHHCLVAHVPRWTSIRRAYIEDLRGLRHLFARPYRICLQDICALLLVHGLFDIRIVPVHRTQQWACFGAHLVFAHTRVRNRSGYHSAAHLRHRRHLVLRNRR